MGFDRMKRSSLMGIVLVLVAIGIISLVLAANGGVLIFSSPETQALIESPTVPYDQKKAVLYAEAIQQDNPKVREYANLRTSAIDPDGDTLSYVCDIWDDLNKNWKYVNDPLGPEYISSSLETIKADLRGDCDDYSVLMSGLAESIGADTRIVNVAGVGGNPGHSFPEYYIGDIESDVISVCKYISARYGCDSVYYSFNGEDGRTVYWLNLDWTVGAYPDTLYFIYGETTGYDQITHPGNYYYGVGQNAVFYYPDGTYASDNPGHGYYQRGVLGQEELNVIQL